MKTIILPGYSPKNRDWAEDLKKNMNLGYEVAVHEWRHWAGGSFSMANETEKIVEEIGQDRVNVIGKSVGARVAMRVLPLVKDRIEKIVLCGIASVNDEAKKTFGDALFGFPPSKIICFQNVRDPFVPYSHAERFIHGINPKISIVEKLRSDHHYPYPQDFQNFLMG